MAAAVRSEIDAAVAAYDVDESELMAGGAYLKELLAAAAQAGVAMFEDDGQLLCYPSIVRILAAEQAWRSTGGGPVGSARPRSSSSCAAPSRPARGSGPARSSRACSRGTTWCAPSRARRPARWSGCWDVHRVLTLLPGQSREYSRSEFARDLYLLDQSGEIEAGSAGRRLRWAASSGTRQAGVLTTVAVSGQQQRYWGVAFEEPR